MSWHLFEIISFLDILIIPNPLPITVHAHHFPHSSIPHICHLKSFQMVSLSSHPIIGVPPLITSHSTIPPIINNSPSLLPSFTPICQQPIPILSNLHTRPSHHLSTFHAWIHPLPYLYIPPIFPPLMHTRSTTTLFFLATSSTWTLFHSRSYPFHACIFLSIFIPIFHRYPPRHSSHYPSSQTIPSNVHKTRLVLSPTYLNTHLPRPFVWHARKCRADEENHADNEESRPLSWCFLGIQIPIMLDWIPLLSPTLPRGWMQASWIWKFPLPKVEYIGKFGLQLRGFITSWILFSTRWVVGKDLLFDKCHLACFLYSR